MNIVRSGKIANCFRLAPPLTVTEDEIDLAVEILDTSITAVLAGRPGLAGSAGTAESRPAIGV
jgi:hypothetical protein